MAKCGWKEIGIAALLLGATGLAHPAAAQSIVEKCLAGSYYPDGGQVYDDCEAALKTAGLPDKTLAKINLQMAEALYFAHRPNLALPLLETVLKQDPALDRAFLRRGWLQLNLEHYDAALADFTDYLERRPDDPDGQFAIAFFRDITTRDCLATAAAYEGILAAHPDHYLTRRNLAQAYRCIDGNDNRNLQQLDKIVAAGREKITGVTYYARRGGADYDFYADVRRRRRDIYYSAGRDEDTIAESTWLIEAYPSMPENYAYRGAARHSLRDFSGALADSDKSLAIQPWDPAVVRTKLSALLGLKRYEDVVAAANPLIDSGMDNDQMPWIYFWRATAFENLGRKREAIHDVHIAMAANDGIIWSTQTQLQQHGYLFGPPKYSDRDPVPDVTTKEFSNGLEACMIDPECFQ